MAKKHHCVILVTAPNLKTARKIARSSLKHELIACANIVRGLESHYKWEGKVEQGNEVLLILKSHRDKIKELEKHVLAQHPYKTPEFVVLKIAAGNQRYLDWLTASCGL